MEMRQLNEYLNTKVKVVASIKATNETLNEIVHREIEKLGPKADLNHIDVSEVTNMDYVDENQPENIEGLFSDTDFRGDVSRWDVSNVENMSSVFYKCKNFNCDLSAWDVSHVKYAGSLFHDCYAFEGKGLQHWNIVNLKDTYAMFANCGIFNADIRYWDTQSIVNCNRMFDGCISLKRDLSNWNVRNVKNHVYMFYGVDYYEDFSKRPKFRT